MAFKCTRKYWSYFCAIGDQTIRNVSLIPCPAHAVASQRVLYRSIEKRHKMALPQVGIPSIPARLSLSNLLEQKPWELNAFEEEMLNSFRMHSSCHSILG